MLFNPLGGLRILVSSESATNDIYELNEYLRKNYKALQSFEGIIMHHSATKDAVHYRDTTGIKRFHTSYRIKGRILSKAEVDKKIYAKFKKKPSSETERKKLAAKCHIQAPWRDVGYQFLIEQVDSIKKETFWTFDSSWVPKVSVVETLKESTFTLQIGRPLTDPKTGKAMSGAHTRGCNRTHIGICVVGNFDKKVPSKELLKFGANVVNTIRRYQPGITVDKVEPHRKYAKKTCPGRLFDMILFRSMLTPSNKLNTWRPE